MTANTPTPRHSIPVHVLLVAIHEAFHDRWSYGCMTVTKLGEQEILDHLARRGLVPIGLGRLSIAALSRDNLIPHTIVWALRQYAGVRYLTDLSGWTYADVLALERVSRTAVNELQDTMVRYGLLLKGGDPVLLERRLEPAPDRTYRGPAKKDPQEIRQNCFKALITLGKSVLRDGASLVRIAAMVGAGHPQARVLRHYVSHGTQAFARDVAAIVGPLLELEDREKQRGQERAKARRRRSPAPAPVEPEDNVVRYLGGITEAH